MTLVNQTKLIANFVYEPLALDINTNMKKSVLLNRTLH